MLRIIPRQKLLLGKRVNNRDWLTKNHEIYYEVFPTNTRRRNARTSGQRKKKFVFAPRLLIPCWRFYATKNHSGYVSSMLLQVSNRCKAAKPERNGGILRQVDHGAEPRPST